MIDTLKFLLDEATGFQVLDKRLSSASWWHSLNITYHPPRVERIWTQYGDNRIFLHVIHPCEPDEALLHPHDWPSAMYVVRGRYEHKVGYHPGLNPGDDVDGTWDLVKDSVRCLTTLELSAGSSYEMLDPLAFHSVRPLDDSPALSVMVTGQPWEKAVRLNFPKPNFEQRPLPTKRVEEMLNLFANAI